MTRTIMYVTKQDDTLKVQQKAHPDDKRPTADASKCFDKHNTFDLYLWQDDFNPGAEIVKLMFYRSCEDKNNKNPYWVWQLKEQKQAPRGLEFIEITSMSPRIEFKFAKDSELEDIHIFYGIGIQNGTDRADDYLEVDPELIITKDGLLPDCPGRPTE